MAARKKLPATLVVDHDCGRRCRTEFDLDDVHGRMSLSMMLGTVEQAHDEAHAAEPPQRVFKADKQIVVRAGQLAVADV